MINKISHSKKFESANFAFVCVYEYFISYFSLLRVPLLFFDRKLDFELSIGDDSPKCYLQLETSLDLKELTGMELLG